MSANLQLYEKEAIDFLQTATIVFSPLAVQINANLMAQNVAVDETDPASWKYYLNLSGQYHSADTIMTVLSLDTKQMVNFTTAMLAASPKTAAAYVVGSASYAALCQAYPNQADLIKSIVYPVDLQAALAAPDLTLLGWGDGYLEVNEQDVILQELRAFIAYVATRWYFSFLSYEVYYIWAFWASLWQALPNAIYAARLKYLHTSSAHSFHIWSYLQSNGIGDYSDILTSQQALFLYRNLNYIKQNKGKQSTLVLLVNKLLDSLNVGLVGKTIYMNTATAADSCAWTPEFVSTIIPTNNAQSLEVIAPETMTMVNADLVAAGFEVDVTPAYIASRQTAIGLTPHNILTTKLVEIQKLGVDQKYGSLLNTFILDTLVYAITSGLYVPTVTITDPTTKVDVALTGKDALALYYYAVHRSCHERPTVLPSLYSPSCAFRPNLATATFPESFTYNGYTYPTRSYLSLDSLLQGVGYPAIPVDDPEIFSELVAGLFLVLIRYVRYARIVGDKIALEMFLAYCNTCILQTTPYTYALSSAPNYQVWADNLALTGLLGRLDAQADYATAYMNLATTITTALLPEDSAVYTFFAYTNPGTNDLYDRLRGLFVQLCSYNIAFLDTDRTNAWWFLCNNVVYTVAGLSDAQSLEITGVDSGTPVIVQVDMLPLRGIATSVEIGIAGDGVEPLKLTANDTVAISQLDDTTVRVPLTLEPRALPQTDTVIIPYRVGLRVGVIAPSV